jgi:hypothetical protein
MTIPELRARLAELDATIQTLSTERTKLRTALAELLSPFKVGDLVTDGRDEFRICRIGLAHSSPWIYGHRIRKDGTPESRERHLYGGNKLRLVAKAAS